MIIDKHDNHVLNKFIVSCTINKIYLCTLPLHTSYITQPLDVRVFSDLKRSYYKFFENFSHNKVGIVTSKRDFLYYYYKARIEVINRRNILSGWQATGL